MIEVLSSVELQRVAIVVQDDCKAINLEIALEDAEKLRDGLSEAIESLRVSKRS